jgi:hypothetical protein
MKSTRADKRFIKANIGRWKPKAARVDTRIPSTANIGDLFDANEPQVVFEIDKPEFQLPASSGSDKNPEPCNLKKVNSTLA